MRETYPRIMKMNNYTEADVLSMFKQLERNVKNGRNLMNDEIKNLNFAFKSGLNTIDADCKRIVDTLIAVSGVHNIQEITYTYKASKSEYVIAFNKCKRAEKGYKSRTVGIVCKDFEIGSREFYYTVVSEVAACIELYGRDEIMVPVLQMLYTNIDSFLLRHKICFSIQWDIGEDLNYIDDNCVIFGVDDTGIVDLLTNFRRIFTNENLYDTFADTLKMCINPLDLLLVDNEITRMLGIYKRGNLTTRISKVYKKPLAQIHTGVGFVKTDDYFAVVNAASLTEESAKYLANGAYYVTENKNPTREEKETNKMYIAYTFIIKPVGKYNLPQKVRLEEIIANLG